MPTVVSLREFCRMQGWNPGYGHKLKEAGRLVTGVDERDREGIDVEASLVRLRETADPSKGHMQQVNAEQRAKHRPDAAPQAPAEPQSANATFNRARTAREVWEAKTAELDYRERAGELVNKSVIRSEMSQRVAQMREAHLALSARLAPVLAQEGDARKVRALLDAELRAALSHVAGVEQQQ